jgi:hypothetical protein
MRLFDGHQSPETKAAISQLAQGLLRDTAFYTAQRHQDMVQASLIAAREGMIKRPASCSCLGCGAPMTDDPSCSYCRRPSR